MTQPSVAIVGAGGAVGLEMLHVLEKRDFPVARLTLFGSARSAGSTLDFRGTRLPVRELDARSFAAQRFDLAFFSAGEEVARKFAPLAASQGCVVIDNSSAFRADPLVPLIIPEINGDELDDFRDGIIANPNCTTAITLMALAPLHRAFHCERIVATSFQAVSGAGSDGVAELQQQALRWVPGDRLVPDVFPHQILFNVIPAIGSFNRLDDWGSYSTEELKLRSESRKILRHPAFRASATCVRVPVFRSHTVSVMAQFARPVLATDARAILRQAPGIRVVDDPNRHSYPMPIHAALQDDCLVGRIRNDDAFDNALSFVVSGDQLLKGAALNAVQIAEMFL